MEKIIVANWKMNGSTPFIDTFIPSVKAALIATTNQVIICPPFPFLPSLKAALKETNTRLGAQNCHIAPKGAYTGEVSAAMLADIGCQAVIVGHSERRTLFGESDDIVSIKAACIHEAGMTAIVCVGESLIIRQSNQALDAVVQQLRANLPPSASPQNTLIAYEPLWAIGSGLTASPGEINEMHQALYAAINKPFPLLYGGSVTDLNAAEILSLPHVDGILVGGASLNPEAFQKIVRGVYQ